ncbi:MAG: deoxyribose-phosphate aldolase [Deltaproteobacteria bacterium]|nr:deoxyribose-phosphate aldolase [Deltaproteobacteria bacterium]
MADIFQNNKTLSSRDIHFIFEQTVLKFASSPLQTAIPPIILDIMSKRIEHTLLKMDATPSELTTLCNETILHGFRGVCCLPRYIAHCRSVLRGTEALVISVVDFPLGGATQRDVASLVRSAISDGADEVDMVLDVPSLKSGELNTVFERIALVTEAASARPVKVILETACLTEPEIVTACAIAGTAGAAFVKTSTGFASRGASIRDIEIMKAAVGDSMRIKASGGIKDAVFAKRLVDAGADVIGTSAGPACIA